MNVRRVVAVVLAVGAVLVLALLERRGDRDRVPSTPPGLARTSISAECVAPYVSSGCEWWAQPVTRTAVDGEQSTTYTLWQHRYGRAESRPDAARPAVSWVPGAVDPFRPATDDTVGVWEMIQRLGWVVGAVVVALIIRGLVHLTATRSRAESS